MTLAHAIEPFFSTKDSGKGIGLIVHGLAEQLGGVLRLTSVPGESTTAEMGPPVASAPVGANERTALPARGPAGDRGYRGPSHEAALLS